jgi:hypothetical protein
MRLPINSASVREILLRHDPVAAWSDADARDHGYADAAELAASSLRNMLGVGHVWTVVADAIDRQYPGFYRAVRSGDPELERRIGLVAREIWDRHGNIIPRPTSVRQVPSGPLPEPPPAPEMVAEAGVLEGWLREMEGRLDAERVLPVPERQSAAAMRSVLEGLVEAYSDGSDGEREEARLAFSRFPLCCYQLASFAGIQYAGLLGPDPARALRHALLAESLLDIHFDWRDELLLIQALKQRAETLKLPYSELLELAAARSSSKTADFLRNA